MFVCARPIFVSLDLGDDLVCSSWSQRGEGAKSVLMREGGGEEEREKMGEGKIRNRRREYEEVGEIVGK